jgi:hypothetical protein
MGVLLTGDEQPQHGDRRFHAWRWFTEPVFRETHPTEDHPRLSRAIVADLRATHARRHGDRDVDGLVRRLLTVSDEFVELWHQHEVAVRRADRKRFRNPSVGLIEVDCETLTTPDQRQVLLIFTPVPGTDAAEKLDLLSVVGLQDFASPTG